MIRGCHSCYKWAIECAARGGHEAIVRLCHDKWDATAVGCGYGECSEGGHEAIERLYHDEWHASEWHVSDVDWAAGGVTKRSCECANYRYG